MQQTTRPSRRQSAGPHERPDGKTLPKQYLEPVVRLLGAGGDAVFVHPLSKELRCQVFCKVNEAASIQTGRTCDELCGLSFLDLLPRESEAGFRAAIEVLHAAGSAVFGGAFVSPGGKRIPVEIRMQTFEMSGKAMALSVSRDVSEKQIAEEERRKLSRVVTQSPAVVMITDVNANIEYVNPKFEETTGFAAGEAVGKTPRIIQSGLHTREFYAGMWDCLKVGRPWSGELCNRKKSGELYWEAAAISPVRGAAGEVTHFVAVKEDITERKQLEAALRFAKEVAERANRAKSAFLANMSHEIRTPMNAILGFTQLMQRDPALTPQQKQYLDTISRSGEHLLGLINSVLEMSKIESGRVVANPTAFNLPGMLTELEMLFRPRIEAKRLRFIVERAGDLPRAVVADEGKLRQVLINLLGNAVKFTNSGGIALRIATRRDDQGGLRLKIEIEDTGSGIAKGEMDRLFHHFEQTESGQRSGTGTGLGLAISREYVRLMGGELSASSEVGEGSLFRFEIRLQEAETDGLPGRRQARRVLNLKGGRRGIRVLIADDREDNRRLLVEMLQSVGFETLQAENGEEAVRLYAANPANLIIMDVRMPVMDGNEAIRRIRSTPEGKSVPIISITASAFSENRREVLAAGADEFLGKPFMEADLYEKIARLLGIEYEYAGETADSVGGALAAPARADVPVGIPGDLALRMREATLNGNMEGLHELLDLLARDDAALADELRKLADRYEYETLIRRLSPGQ